MFNLKEFLWGTPQEIQADQRYAELKSKKRLNNTQRVELARVSGLSKRLYIRRIATVVGGAGIFISPAAYAILRSTSQPDEDLQAQQGLSTEAKYDGPLVNFKGLEYVPRNSLLEMTEVLKNTGHPILDKAARGIRALSSAKTKPQEFPSWIDERSFPFVFVQDYSNAFTTKFQISGLSGDKAKFTIPSAGTTEPQEGIDKFLVGIKFGLKYTPLSGDLLQPAILLAKEYLTLLHGISLNEEFYDMVKALFPNTAILDDFGQEITDRSKQKAVGRRLFFNNLDESNVNWKVLDGFSMLLLGPVLKDLVASGRMKSYGSIRPIVLAANIVTNGPAAFQKDMADFMETWRLKEGFTFPTGTGAKSVSKPYLEAVTNLENQIEQAEKADK